MPSGIVPHGQQRANANNRHAITPTKAPEQSRSFEEIMTARAKPLYGITPFHANTDNRLTSFEFRVFSTMCGFANNETHLCWPKQKTLAALLHTSVSQISQTIARLVGFGYVETQKIGFPARNVYRIIWEIPPKSAENSFPNVGEPADEPSGMADETCLPATEFTVGETQTLPASKPSVYRGVKSLNRPLEQTIVTPVSEGSNLSTSLAPLARTREGFDAAALRRDPLFIAVCAYLPEPVLPAEWRRWATMINHLRRGGVSAADIPTAVKGWQLRWDIGKLTLPALVYHWAEIREGKTGEQVHQAIRDRQHAAAERTAQQRRHAERGEFQRLYNECLGLPADTPLPAGVHDESGA